MEYQTKTILYEIETDREKGETYNTVTPTNIDELNIFTGGSKLSDKRT